MKHLVAVVVAIVLAFLAIKLIAGILKFVIVGAIVLAIAGFLMKKAR